VDRLLFIAGASTDASVQLEALRLAHEEVRRVRPPAEHISEAELGDIGINHRLYRSYPPCCAIHNVAVYLQAGNVARYTELMERSGGRLGPPDR
jgi:hypothetical protein